MKARVCKVTSLIVAFLVAVFSVGYAFAWLVNRRDAELNINGSSQSAYFAGGNGSAEYPYLITNYVHMRNLAVLQNTGRLVDRNKEPCKYYFAVMNDVDMSGMYIPPIGNDEYPFIGDFNGNGHTISAVQVTTDKSLLKVSGYTVQSDSTYKFSQAVGLFGMTGSESVIKNFILDEPTVEVANTENEKTAYLTAATDVDGKTVAPASKTVGLAVGHVEGKCSSIGVRTADKGAALNVDIKGYSTFNSILGELGEGVQSSVTGGGYGEGSGGSGSSFGASFDVASMLDRLYNIYKGKYGVEYQKGNDNEPLEDSSPFIPQISTANAYPVPAAGAKIAFSADVSKSTYEGPDAAEVISNQNVGYFLGNENKFDVKNLTFSEKLTNPNNDWSDWYITENDIKKTPADSGKVPAWFYTYNEYVSFNPGTVYVSAQGFRELTQAEFDDLPANIIKLLPEVGEQKQFTTIRISQDGVGTGNWGDGTNKTQWSYHGQISWMGNTYGQGFKSADGKAVDENGNILPVTAKYDEEGNYIGGDYYVGNGEQTQGFNFYTGGVALPNNAIWFKPAQVGKFRFVMFAQDNGDGFIMEKIVRTNADKDNPFAVDPTAIGDDVVSQTVIQQILPKNVFFYYEYDFTEEEYLAGNVEFMLQKTGNGGAHFVYLDIGASAAEDESGVADDKAVSAIDFIYDGVSISKEEDADKGIKIGDFIVSVSGSAALYEASKTSIYFENTQSVLNIVFIRLNGRDDKKTLDISNSSPVPSRTGEVKATVPTYVIPDVGSGS